MPTVASAAKHWNWTDSPTRGAVSAPVRFRSARVADIPQDKALILRFEVSGAEVFGYEWMNRAN